MSAMMTSKIALIALLAAGPTSLWAQTTTETPPADGTLAPGAGGNAVTDLAPEVEAEVPPQPVEGQIVMQGDGTVLASDLIGSSVYSTADESIGEINDMILNLDGTIEGVVIGVGGFLGLGEKRVAIEMGQLTLMTDPETTDTQLQTSATRDDLEAAPEFMDVDDQQAAQPVTTDGLAPADGSATMPADGSATMPADTTMPPADATMPPADGTTPPPANN